MPSEDEVLMSFAHHMDTDRTVSSKLQKKINQKYYADLAKVTKKYVILTIVASFDKVLLFK